MALFLSGIPEADALLERDPFALLIGMVLDQQIPLERAFAAPAELRERLGGRLEVEQVARMDPEALVAAFSERPALHRFPAAMAERVQLLAQLIVDEFDGDAGAVWARAKSGEELFKTLKRLPGFGEQKARIFVGFLGKQLGVRPRGWREAAGKFGEKGSFSSIADITSAAALERVRAYKKEMKAAAKAAAPVATDAPAKRRAAKG